MTIYYVDWDRDDDAYPYYYGDSKGPSSDYAYIEADSPEEAIEIAKKLPSDVRYPDLDSYRAKEKQLEKLTKEIDSLDYYHTRDEHLEPLIPNNLTGIVNTIKKYIREIDRHTDKEKVLKKIEEFKKLKNILFKIEKNNKEQKEIEKQIEQNQKDLKDVEIELSKDIETETKKEFEEFKQVTINELTTKENQLNQLKEELIEQEGLKNIALEEVKIVLKS